MTDVDIFAKLSRILETHNVAPDEEDDSSVLELLQRIAKDGNKDDKFGTSTKAKSKT